MTYRVEQVALGQMPERRKEEAQDEGTEQVDAKEDAA